MWKSKSFLLRIIFVLLIKSLYVDNASANPAKQKICVIGAGAAGLASAKHFSEKSDKFDVVVFEKQSDVGGLWIYSNSTVDNHGLPIHSSVYNYLRTNFPRKLMSYPDYQEFHGEDNHSIVHHRFVLEYLRNYTEAFNLRRFVKFDTLVENVKPIPGNGDWRTTRWRVDTRNLNDNTRACCYCNAVVVCNGHNFKQRVPSIKGIETYTGKVVHSHVYRFPEDYEGKRVAILGAGFSGLDIAIEISRYAEIVYLSHNHAKIESPLPSNIVQVAGVVGADGDELILKDNSAIEADVLVLCTGYVYDFPFLNQDDKIRVDNNQIQYLYKHIVNVEYPNMAFIGISSNVIFYPLFNRQVKYFVSLMEGTAELPSREEMLRDSTDLHGKPQRKAHALGDDQWAYFDELSTLGGFEKLPDFYKEGTIVWDQHHFSDFVNFRESDLVFYDNGTAAIVPWY